MKTVRFGTQGRTGRTRGREEMKPGDGQDTHLGSKINGSRETGQYLKEDVESREFFPFSGGRLQSLCLMG